MFFTIPAKNGIRSWRAAADASKRAMAFPFGADELLLDGYLRANEGMGLREACRMLCSCCRANASGDDIVITFKTAAHDRLASIITYGTGRISGSRILRFAFRRD